MTDKTPDRQDWMPNRGIRIPDSIWNPAKDEAKRRGESLAEAIRRFLDRYGRGED